MSRFSSSKLLAPCRSVPARDVRLPRLPPRLPLWLALLFSPVKPRCKRDMGALSRSGYCPLFLLPRKNSQPASLFLLDVGPVVLAAQRPSQTGDACLGLRLRGVQDQGHAVVARLAHRLGVVG